MIILSQFILVKVLILSCVCSVWSQFVRQPASDLFEFPELGVIKYVVHVSSRAGICTGIIINKDWILTAAHCFYFRNKLIDNRDASIIAGTVDYTDLTESEIIFRTVSEKIHVHPLFGENKPSKYDVALVKVRDPLEFGRYLDKIKVADDAWPDANGTVNCIVVGFGGYPTTEPASTVLKVWNVSASHGESGCPCARRFQWKRMVCVVEPVGHSRMCLSDDGGPMVCGQVVRAIAHMIWDRDTCDNVGYPKNKCIGYPQKTLSLYMFLCPMNSWLHSIVPDIPPTPQSCRGPHTHVTSQLLIWAVLLVTVDVVFS